MSTLTSITPIQRISRTQELLDKGLESLKQEEVLTLLMDPEDPESIKTAERLLNEHISLYDLSKNRSNAETLMEVAGMTAIDAVRVAAAAHLAEQFSTTQPIADPATENLLADVLGPEITQPRCREWAKELLTQAGSLKGLLELDLNASAEARNIDFLSLTRLLASLEMAVRVEQAASM